MLYRRHLRIKALQALYSWYSGGFESLPVGEKQLLKSIDKLYELFVYQLSFLVEVRRFTLVRIEENKNKYFPTEEDLNPNLKFVNNRVLTLLDDNRDFLKKEEVLKVNWSQEQEMFLKFYHLLRNSDFYAKYLSETEDSLEEDKKFVIKVIDRLMLDFEILRSYYDEKDMYFTEGYDLTNILLVNFVDSITTKFTVDSSLPGIYKTSGQKVNDDEYFARTLFRKVILNDDEYSKIVEGKTKNWDYDRIPLIDVILLKMAIVELLEMNTIPVKVTMNEYIELAKYFSTAKSKIFINGVLDKLISEFKTDERIKKTGRGLID
ncbi:MAG: transcription antitermination factor NusB [Bacteroidales bacterium]|nr:transcription antitermination factor NusB [Bacteroidales bacterium]